MTELLLKGVETTSMVKEVYRVAVAEQMGVSIPLEPSPASRFLDYLVSPLLCDVATLA